MKMTADDTNRARVLITGKVLNGNRDKALPALEGACLSVVNKSQGTKATNFHLHPIMFPRCRK